MNTGEQIGFLIFAVIPGIISVILWAALGFLIILLIKLVIKKAELRKKFLVVIVIFLIWYPLWTIFPGELLAKRECQINGGLDINKSIPPIEGYLRPQITFEKTLEELATKKFKYVEIVIEGSTPLQRFAYKWAPERHVGLRDPEIHRFYLVDSSALVGISRKQKISACYAREMREVEKKYMPETICIAYKKVNEPLSQYQLIREEYSNYFPVKINWNVSKIIDLKSAEVVAEYKSFKYGYSFGFASSETQFDCSNNGAKQKFDRLFTPATSNEYIKDLALESPVYKFYNP